MYIRLRSLTTGHQWDASETAARVYLASGGVETVRGPHPTRIRMKPRRSLAGGKPRPITKENQ